MDTTQLAAQNAPTPPPLPLCCPQCRSDVTHAGGVNVESGSYSIEDDSYAAEGTADVYRCNANPETHVFAIDVPFVEHDEDEEGAA